METYFFSQLYSPTDTLPDVEALTDKSLPEDTRMRLFRRYLRHRPEKLLAFLREATLRNVFPLDEWLRVTDASDWLHLAASLSLGKAELLRQITDCLSLPEEERKEALATYIVYGDTGEWPYATPQETVRGFIGMLPSLQEADNEKKEETVHRVEAELALPETEAPEELPEALTVGKKAYDLLLETVPWGFRQIRLPWLKKYVQVKWHEKQIF